jgi:hypothetical protein
VFITDLRLSKKEIFLDFLVSVLFNYFTDPPLQLPPNLGVECFPLHGVVPRTGKRLAGSDRLGDNWITITQSVKLSRYHTSFLKFKIPP